MAIGPGNALFVSDLALATVFRHDGGRLAVWANASAGLTAPEEMAFDDRGNLYVTEETPGHVLRITPNGAHEVFAGRASGLRSPEDVCVHGDHVYVADAAGPSVFRFDLSGDGGRILTLTEEFRSLESIEVDADGTMLLGIRRRRPLPSYVLAVRPRR